VWVALGDTGTVARIDPESGEVAATIEVGDLVGGVVADGDDVWVADVGGDRVVPIDTGDDETGTAVAAGAQPDAIAVADDVLWVVTTDAGTATRIPL
jgi:DNA-binding beta-propeller fold protein YncE